MHDGCPPPCPTPRTSGAAPRRERHHPTVLEAPAAHGPAGPAGCRRRAARERGPAERPALLAPIRASGRYGQTRDRPGQPAVQRQAPGSEGVVRARARRGGQGAREAVLRFSVLTRLDARLVAAVAGRYRNRPSPRRSREGRAPARRGGLRAPTVSSVPGHAREVAVSTSATARLARVRQEPRGRRPPTVLSDQARQRAWRGWTRGITRQCACGRGPGSRGCARWRRQRRDPRGRGQEPWRRLGRP